MVGKGVVSATMVAALSKYMIIYLSIWRRTSKMKTVMDTIHYNITSISDMINENINLGLLRKI